LAGLALSFAAAMPVAMADTAWATTAYQQAENLFQAGQYDQALALYEQIIGREPGAKLSYCRAGTAAAGAGQLVKAIGFYKTCEQLYPESMLPRAELVKLYQIGGDRQNRDRERNGLLTLHQNSNRAETKSIDHYIRDIFAVGPRSIVTWEYFDLLGGWPSRYRFFVLDDQNRTVFTVALSSSDQANAHAQAFLGRPAKARVFQLDLERANTITTLKIFEGEPGYDVLKPLVVDAIVKNDRSTPAP
jgi:tetratricopeptide (TPR) repeat protein